MSLLDLLTALLTTNQLWTHYPCLLLCFCCHHYWDDKRTAARLLKCAETSPRHRIKSGSDSRHFICESTVDNLLQEVVQLKLPAWLHTPSSCFNISFWIPKWRRGHPVLFSFPCHSVSSGRHPSKQTNVKVSLVFQNVKSSLLTDFSSQQSAWE